MAQRLFGAQIMAVSILILAAGLSSRMRGADKLTKPFKGTTLLARIAAEALDSQADEVVAVLPRGHAKRRACLPVGVKLAEVEDETPSLSRSLAVGIAAADPSSDVMVVLADMPDVTATHMDTLIDAARIHSSKTIFRLADAQGNPGHPVLFRAQHSAALCALKGDQGARELIRRHQNEVHLVPSSDNAARVDLDTSEDWDAYR